MAQSFQTTGGLLIIPDGYSQYSVNTLPSNNAINGVIAIVGEADAGPDYSLESDLNLNAFGPNQLSDVVLKYKSGNLVDAYRGIVSPSNDPNITGGPSRIVLVKTNVSGKASSAIAKVAGGTWATLFDKSYGLLGNLIYYTITSASPETLPTTGPFTWIAPVGTVDLSIRVNGATAVAPSTFAAGANPATAQAALNALTGVACSGGALRTVIPGVAGNIAVGSVVGNSCVISYDATWNTIPSVGDTLMIPTSGPIIGAGNANVGAYVVTAATTNSISVTKLSDALKPGAVIGTITAPVAVSSAAVTLTTNFSVWAPLTITQSSATILDGVGKTLEINQLTTGTDLLARVAYNLSTTVVTWVSKSASPTNLVSASEYAVNLNVNRQSDGSSEVWTAGGQIGLKMGYTGTTCVVVVTPTSLSTTVTGGSGANLTLSLTQFKTLNDVANFINSQTGYTAAVGTAAAGQLISLMLDEGTFTAGSTFGTQTLRLKVDAAKLALAVSSSNLIQFNNPASTPAAGLPALVAVSTYLSGGTKGGTTNALYQAAVDGLQAVNLNFIVPLFSQDATADITLGATDPSSTYDIATINAYIKSHCLLLSTLKRKKNRQGFLSIRTTFTAAQTAAQNIASFRCSMSFQDCKDIGTNGLTQFQPWMTACKAAGMQAAGFYKAIFNKAINCSGMVQAAGDFKDSNDTQVENALLAGLLPVRRNSDGTYRFVSDQTTYSTDSNFLFNSVQATYDADYVSVNTAIRMANAFVGQSTADVSASIGLATFKGIMADWLRLKLIAPSDDAPLGFKNSSVILSNGVMQVQAEIKLAGAIYFVYLNFNVTLPATSAS